MTHYMCDTIATHHLTCVKSDKCKLIIIKGNGGKAFCAGGDLKGLLDLSLSGARDDFSIECTSWSVL
ncbi:hypothetical protein BJV82DRAFT_672842 [Fennellomyces sp. T-0311]|nr:hypothetical protein BJV82DRAFT_672842 [Fennellomyces sp. T-0311]